MLIDWNRVNELKDEIGADDFAEIVELFLEEVEETINDVKANTDKTVLEAPLHFLKGSAVNLGFAEFSNLCQLGETAAAKSDFDSIDLAEILSSYDLSKEEFMKSL